MSNRQDKFQGLLRDQADMCRLEDSDHVADLLDEAADAIASLQARLDAAEKDAARYRWLRDVGDATWRPFALREGYSAAQADRNIDAAMGKS